MDKLGENLKKLVLAGVGAVATTAEKSQEILDDLVKKGEITVEQGKTLNEELKHNVKAKVKDAVKINVDIDPETPETLDKVLGDMTPEQLAALKDRISAIESAAPEEKAEEAPAEEEK